EVRSPDPHPRDVCVHVLVFGIPAPPRPAPGDQEVGPKRRHPYPQAAGARATEARLPAAAARDSVGSGASCRSRQAARSQGKNQSL
ncbi:MAG: hypothetical protein AVDCRST_MAG91-1914, partial [uncultured Sphingomonadaceae bacterium]